MFDSGGGRGGGQGDIVRRREKSETNTSGGQIFEVFTNQIMKLN